MKLPGVNLDIEKKKIGDLVKITIRALENGNPISSVRKEISLSLIDINDNAPVVKNS